MVYRLDRNKLSRLLREIAREEAGTVVEPLMKKFDDEIVPFEDSEDPARPSMFRSEFREFLVSTVLDNISTTITSAGKETNSIAIDIGIGDEDKLGFGEKLDEDTTDGLMIIGTIIQGIVGEYVLVTRDMTGRPEGRFGRAFILPVEQYRKEAPSKGWDPNKPIWKFSNFRGLPDFFQDVDLGDFASNVTKKLVEALRK